MSNSTKTVSHVFILILLSKFLGQIREVYVAHFYGTGPEATAFYAAMQIPLSFFDMVLGFAIVSAFVPVFNECFQKNGKVVADKFAGNFITVFSVLSVVLTVLGIIFSYEIVNLMAYGLKDSPQTLQLTTELLKIIFPALIFTTLAYAFAGILQSYGEFRIPAAMSLVSNFITILYFIIFGEKVTIYGVTVSMLLGWVMQFVILIPKLKKFGYKYTFDFSFKNQLMVKVYKLTGPVILSSWVQPLNIMINLFLASFVENGAAVPAVNYANRIYLIIASVFAVSLTNVTLPSLSRFFADKNSSQAALFISNSIKATILFLLPVMGMFCLYAQDIIRIVYESGNFDKNSTVLTAIALTFYSLGMLGYALNEVINKSFYAMQKSKITMKVALVTIIINTVCSFSLYRIFGIAGLAFSTSLATNTAAVILIVLIKKYVNDIKIKEIIKIFVKGILSVIVSLGVSYMVYTTMTGFISGRIMNLLVLFATGVVCIVVYVLMLMLFKVKELYELKRIFFKER